MRAQPLFPMKLRRFTLTVAACFPGVFALAEPGTKIVLKVYGVTTTGRERGSAPMLVERPAA